MFTNDYLICLIFCKTLEVYPQSNPISTDQSFLPLLCWVMFPVIISSQSGLLVGLQRFSFEEMRDKSLAQSLVPNEVAQQRRRPSARLWQPWHSECHQSYDPDVGGDFPAMRSNHRQYVISVCVFVCVCVYVTGYLFNYGIYFRKGDKTEIFEIALASNN